MWWLTFSVGVLVALIFLIATVVILRSKSRIHQTFALFAYVTAIWVVANYVGANFKDHFFALYFVHADFLFGAAAAFCFWYFAVALFEQTSVGQQRKRWLRRLHFPFWVLSIGSMLLSLSPWVVQVKDNRQGIVSLGYGSGYTMYALMLGLILMAGLVMIVLTLRFADHELKRQIRTISHGLTAAVVLVAAANLILPQLTHSKAVNLIVGNMAYVGLVAFIGSTYYAIFRQKFFDIRTFAIRAMAYAFSVMIMTIFYIAPGVLLILYFFDIHLTTTKTLILLVVTYILAVIYLYIRALFDKITSRIFFRDKYETQDVLHHLSELLVRTTDLGRLQQESKKILVSVLRVGSLEYWLDRQAQKEMFDLFHELPSSEKGNVLILGQIPLRQDVERAFVQKKIAAVVRLRTTQGILGYMTMDYKSSGASFSQQDIRLLSTAADEIAISMQNALHFDEIRNFNETLQENVSEATRKLRKTNEKLQNLDITKDEFITMASHQLRTPLTAVKGYLSMVLEGDAGKLNAQQSKLLQQSYMSAQRMVYLISDLLNLSRLSTGKFLIEPAPVNLADIVQAEIDQLAETAKAREVALNYKRPASFPQLMLDETKTHQVVMNFIDNAIYYTPAGGTIDVEVEDMGTAIEYRVKDNGIGVPRAQQHHLFSKFYRADNARRARPDGTGLGLFMAKKVIVGQGGAILFESEEGKGSTFGFRFNKRSHLVPAGTVPVAEGKHPIT